MPKKLPRGEEKIITWQAPEYFVFKKTVGWYTTISTLTLAISLFFWFVLHKWLPVIVTLFSASLLFYYGNLEPRIITYSISSAGIKISRRFYPWPKLKSFWFIATKAGIVLYLETTNRFQPSLIVQLGNQNPDEIRLALAKYLPEKPSGREETIDYLARILRF